MSDKRAATGGRQLFTGLAALVGLGLTWLVVLPWIGKQPPVRQHVETLHAADVNASAMFYSELECKYMLAK